MDYSAESVDLADVKESVPVQGTLKDETPPEICEISLGEVDYETGIVRINLTAADYDTPMLYYQYSFDGGLTFPDYSPGRMSMCLPEPIRIPLPLKCRFHPGYSHIY